MVKQYQGRGKASCGYQRASFLCAERSLSDVYVK